jgi:hypothetical protein
MTNTSSISGPAQMSGAAQRWTRPLFRCSRRARTCWREEKRTCPAPHCCCPSPQWMSSRLLHLRASKIREPLFALCLIKTQVPSFNGPMKLQLQCCIRRQGARDLRAGKRTRKQHSGARTYDCKPSLPEVNYRTSIYRT